MSDFSDFLNVIKKAAIEAVKAENPTIICFGTVTSTKPLKISVDQKLILTNMQLVVPEMVSKYPLKKNDNVILLREQGGQRYIVMDRMVNQNDTK